MDGVIYRKAETPDYPEILTLIRGESWTTQIDDLENFKNLHANGFQVAKHGDKVLGKRNCSY